MNITGVSGSINRDLPGLRDFMVETVDAILDKVTNGNQVLRIPRYWLDDKPSKGMIVHDSPELFYQVAGTTVFEFPGDVIHVNEGDVCYVPGNVFHKERVLKRKGNFCQLVVVAYNSRLTYHLGGSLGSGPPGILLRSELITYDTQVGAEYFEGMARLFHHAKESNMSVILGALRTYLEYLRLRIDATPAKRERLSGVVQRCRYLIHTHFHDPTLNVQSLAEWCDCTPNHLSAVFMKDTGVKVTESINQMRIDRARKLLRDTHYQISEIAWISGFGSANYFSRCFRKMTGQTPRAYRGLSR